MPLADVRAPEAATLLTIHRQKSRRKCHSAMSTAVPPGPANLPQKMAVWAPRRSRRNTGYKKQRYRAEAVCGVGHGIPTQTRSTFQREDQDYLAGVIPAEVRPVEESTLCSGSMLYLRALSFGRPGNRPAMGNGWNL